jgi:sugar (pentulose or hexulose) kinase
MINMDKYFIGIDIGTQGARVLLSDQHGNAIAQQQKGFALTELTRQQQSPSEWWRACELCLATLLEATSAEIKKSIISIGVTSTSGTVIPLDSDGLPLHDALMYSDQRSASVAERCSSAAKGAGAKFTAFGSSTSLAKMVWFAEQYPELNKKVYKWVHAADYITGKITGSFSYTDYTNSFKSGYDLQAKKWPDYLFGELGLSREWMLEVVPSGKVIGYINKNLAKSLKIGNQVEVVAGITDGCASQIAAGATALGQWNTTIGTTMVIKGVSSALVQDERGRIYSHLHPSGYWMPGGASNTGADWVSGEFAGELDLLNELAEGLIPSAQLSYPLVQKGERFPFIAPQARGFGQANLTKAERYTANMQGVAYMERYGYELISAISGEPIKEIFTAGGASSSAVWLRIRSSVMNLPIYKMKHVSGAMGAAILAASGSFFGDLPQAANAMNQIELAVFPERELVEAYEINYQRFLDTLIEKGWITREGLYA